jgi:hypothetical protein
MSLGNQIDIVECIISIGRLLAAQDFLEKFACLLGWGQATVPNIEELTSLLFRIETEKFIAKARAVLGNEAYTAAYHAGKQMSFGEAVAYVWQELEQ